MKKALILVLSLSLVAGALALPASAKKKKAKPVATTLYAHGPSAAGEVDGAVWVTEVGKPPLTLDATEPAAGLPKSQNFFSPALNDQCTGLPLAFPTFQGDLSGTIVGDVTMTAHFVSAPSKILARIWTDTPNFSCNDAYVEPVSEVEVDVPAGQSEVEIVFPKLKQKALSWVLVEILAPSGSDYKGQVGRLLYDSADAATRLEFNCIPASGKSCTP